MAHEIETLNSHDVNVSGKGFEKIPLPNVVETIEKYFGNKEQLLAAFESYNNYIQLLYDKAISQQKTEEKLKASNEKLKELQEEVKYLKENRDFYKNEYGKIVTESTYANKRNEKKIDNVIDINKNKEKLTSSDWGSQFPGLFK